MRFGQLWEYVFDVHICKFHTPRARQNPPASDQKPSNHIRATILVIDDNIKSMQMGRPDPSIRLG